MISRIGAVGRRSKLVAKLLDARLAVATWWRERRLTARDRRRLEGLAGRVDLRINIGSSSGHVAGWMSADIDRDAEGLCPRMDAAQPWPFADGSAEAINSEHFIEHLTRHQAAACLREAHRVLRPGGLIRISHGHRYIFDLATLEAMLTEAGFEQVERVEFGQSRHELLRGIDTHDMGELVSLVVAVDAVTPCEY